MVVLRSRACTISAERISAHIICDRRADRDSDSPPTTAKETA